MRPGTIVIAALTVSLTTLSSAEETVPPSSDAIPADAGAPPGSSARDIEAEDFALLESLDRDLTVIRSRTDLVSEFTDLRGSGWSEKLTLGSTWGFHLPGVGLEHEFGVRLQAPW